MIKPDSDSGGRPVFSDECLQHSFQLLRPGHPELALAVQNLLATQRRHTPSSKLQAEAPARLDDALVADIVSALADIAQTLADDADAGQAEKIALHGTLLDWLLYAQRELPSIVSDADQPTP